jgi:hypothetical protein
VSLLDAGADTVVVFPEETYTDSYGNVQRRPAQTGVQVAGCHVQPMTTQPQPADGVGQRVDATWRLICRDAPLGVWSRVEWQGKSLSVSSGPIRRGYSPATSHVSAVLQEAR